MALSGCSTYDEIMKRRCISSLITLWLSIAHAWPNRRGPIVQTSDGPVQGLWSEGVTVYHGLRFAASPTGVQRWRIPQRPQPWQHVHLATTGPFCPQLDIVRGVHLGEEDCLHLSVYVPDQCTEAGPCPTQSIHMSMPCWRHDIAMPTPCPCQSVPIHLAMDMPMEMHTDKAQT